MSNALRVEGVMAFRLAEEEELAWISQGRAALDPGVLEDRAVLRVSVAGAKGWTAGVLELGLQGRVPGLHWPDVVGLRMQVRADRGLTPGFLNWASLELGVRGPGPSSTELGSYSLLGSWADRWQEVELLPEGLVFGAEPKRLEISFNSDIGSNSFFHLADLELLVVPGRTLGR
jgi:hypothetical protein